MADDVTGHLAARTRLASQLVAGALLTQDSSRALGALGTAGIVNVVNFMDGINGISGGTAAVWGINAITLAESADDDLAVIGALTLGSAIGFLPHNVPSARFFLGDVGSYSLGAAVAAGILSRGQLYDRWRIASPLLLYGLDAAQALLHRARTHQRLGIAHRDHIYQRLVDSGVSHAHVAAFHGALAAAVAGVHHLRRQWAVSATVALCGAYFAAPNIRELYLAISPADGGTRQ